MSFQDKVVIVTGGSSGIGAATAIKFAEEGAKVAIVGRNKQKLDNVAKKCGNLLVIVADVCKDADVKKIVNETLSRFGKLDILINNAGIGKSVSIEADDAMAVFDQTMSTNLRSIVYLTHLAVPHLVKTKERLNVLYERNWTRLVHEQLRKFESSIVAAARQSPEAQPPELAMDSKWTFSGALIYCITLITTIGYGNVSPRTAAGRAATVAYAAAGVPLTLACLAGLGASLARLARLAWLRATKRKVPNTWRKDGEPENFLQLHEQQRLLPQPAENNQYTSFPPRSHRSPGTVKARAGDRGQYSQVFERAPASPARAATLGRVKRSALADEPHTSSSLQTQTLDRKKSMGSTKCLATVHGPSRGRGRSTLQRPRGAVIEQLIAEECGDLQMNRSQDDLDDSEDPDESIICPHDTPSRVPLIWNEENHKMKNCTVASSSASTSVQHHIHHGIEHCHIPVGIVLFLLLSYICVGAAIFSAWENWSFLDAAYFCFIALATIGFGDFVPTSFLTTKQSTEHTRSEYVQMIACCVYLVFGLILIAMSFSLLQDEVVARCSQLANSLGLSRQ